ncbi:MAG TPA: glycosyltransferase family 4 protein [Thermoplasmata archaeon]|nr:glycosyltransferase family 4 protein [Thermoplasmata archaeon]
MKVLEVTQRFPPAVGGVEQHVHHVASRLAQAGVEVEVLTTDLLRDTPFTRIRSPLPRDSFPVTRVRAWRMVDAPHGLGIVAPSMVPALLASGADIIHAHSYGQFPTFAGSLASALDHSILIVTPHSDAGRPSWTKSVFDRVVPRLTLKAATRVIAVSEHEAASLINLGVPRDRIRVIPNGVDLGEFAEVGTRKDRDGLVGLFVGRLDPDQKGLDVLVRAMSKLPQNYPLRLRLVGEDWGGAELLRHLAQRLGVADRVTMVGKVPRPEVVREFAEADFLVLPSRFEPFGIVLLEAMAAGLPVVASRVGGIPEIVSEGETGLLVEPDNPDALAEALRLLCQNESLRFSMGRSARERVKRYAWDSVVPRILSVFAEALQENGG